MELQVPRGGALVVPMSREEFYALPDEGRGEWWDGACVVMSSPTWRHSRAVIRLGALIDAVARPLGLEVGAEAGWEMPDAHLTPDLVVTRPSRGHSWLTEPPLLVVEVLSPSTRHIHRGRKRELYAAAGLPWYWLVDLVRDELVVMRSDADTGGFVEVQRLHAGTTAGPLEIVVSVSEL